MSVQQAIPSARQVDLLEQAYRYVLDHGLADMSLRPLAKAIGSSPRVLLYLYGSKDGLVRALLARARADELTMLDRVQDSGLAAGDGLEVAAGVVWSWLVAEEHRALNTLWLEGYARSLVEPEGPWASFARDTVTDWLAVLAEAQPRTVRGTAAGRTQRTLVLAVLRGALLDLLATGDARRTTAAVHLQLAHLQASHR